MFQQIAEQILGLDSVRPLWRTVSTEQQRQQIQEILTSSYQRDRQQALT
jgi:hypothetical protein